MSHREKEIEVLNTRLEKFEDWLDTSNPAILYPKPEKLRRLIDKYYVFKHQATEFINSGDLEIWTQETTQVA